MPASNHPVGSSHATGLRPLMIGEYFRGPIPPVRPSIGYQLGLVIVTTAMVLLPLAYLSIIVGAGYGVYLYAVEAPQALFASSRGGVRFGLWRVIAYAGPLIAGVTIVIFMVKPIFARRIVHVSPYTVEPGQEPALHAFVSAVAQAIGAPSPRVIELDCSVNAGAGFRRGFLSFFGSDLRLLIGMPLLAGLNTRQLAGVLAHELGHFSQTAAMRLTYIIERTNQWFYRVVYERDSWDQWLVEQCVSNSSGWFQLIFLVARLCVWFSRGILFVLMLIGHGLSSFMSRQMEFNADRYEIELAGSQAFASTTRRLTELNAAAGYVNSSLARQAATRQLADDLPALINATVERMPANVRESLENMIQSRRSGLFDSHPALGARIERSARRNAPGVFFVEEPASWLLRNFAVLCKWTTIGHYQNALGPHISAEQLVPVAGVIKQDQIDDGSRQAFERYYAGSLTPAQPLFLPRCDEVQTIDAREQAKLLMQSRKALELAHSSASAAVRALEESQNMLSQACAAEHLLAAGLKCAAPDLGLHSATTAQGLEPVRARLRKAHEDAKVRYKPIAVAITHRLESALRLLRVPPANAKIRRSEGLAKHAETLRISLDALAGVQTTIDGLDRDLLLLHLLVVQARQGQDGDKVSRAIQRTAQRLHEHLRAIRTLLGGAEYPLQRSGTHLTIGAYAVPVTPAPDRYDELINASVEAVNRLRTLYCQMMGRLAMIAERVEAVIGAKPLNVPRQTVDEPAGATRRTVAQTKRATS